MSRQGLEKVSFFLSLAHTLLYLYDHHVDRTVKVVWRLAALQKMAWPRCNLAATRTARPCSWPEPGPTMTSKSSPKGPFGPWTPRIAARTGNERDHCIAFHVLMGQAGGSPWGKRPDAQMEAPSKTLAWRPVFAHGRRMELQGLPRCLAQDPAVAHLGGL